MTRISTRSFRPAAARPSRGRAALSATYLAIFAVAPLGAQEATSAPDARWQPWYGCWAAAPDAPGASAEGAVSCVSPAGGSAVEITTVADGRVTGRERLVADGGARRVERDGCRGTERATWSADGRRVYLHSESACPNNVTRSGDGVLAIANSGEWLDVRAASIGGYTGVRSVRYEPATAPAALPADVAAALTDRVSGAMSARLAASAPVRTAVIVEATRAAGPSVTGAWLAELHQRFALDARQLLALAEAGVPGSVTDVMIATSNPQVFALGPSGTERAAAPRAGRQIPLALNNPRLGLGWGWDGFGWDAGSLGYGYAYSRNAYGYGYGARAYGYNNGYYPGGYWGTGPVVVVVRPTPATQNGGIQRGRGYTQGDAPTSGSARGSGPAAASDAGRASVGSGGYSSGGSSSSGSSTGSSSSGSSSSGSSSSGSSSSGSSSSGSSSSGSLGTAKPRP